MNTCVSNSNFYSYTLHIIYISQNQELDYFRLLHQLVTQHNYENATIHEDTGLSPLSALYNGSCS